MRINVRRVMLQAAENKQKPRPAVKIRTKPVQPDPEPESDRGADPEVSDVVIPERSGEPNSLLHHLEIEYSTIRKERAILSSSIGRRVHEGATQDELKELYHKIESFRPSLQDYYDKIAYVKIYGKLPDPPAGHNQDKGLLELREEKRSLINRRSKLSVEIKKAQAKSPEKVTALQLKLDILDTQYNDVELKIKKLEGKA
jgi:hypothetical protein